MPGRICPMPPRKTARSNAEYRGAAVRPDPPDPSWAPLRHAPYRLQAVPQRLIGLRLQPPRLLERDEISDFVNTAISGTDIVKCELNEAGTCLVVTWKTESYDSTSNDIYDEEYPADLVPYDFRKLYHSPDEQTDDLIRKVEAAWAEMERRLRIAITNSLCHVMARSGSMHAASSASSVRSLRSDLRPPNWTVFGSSLRRRFPAGRSAEP